ncbi:MAG: M20/M25/M40 family metallo-hydrolase [Algicola sp.]|nr:M20/M25/M40 family metallo-hydrolase [Algicola sp.]
MKNTLKIGLVAMLLVATSANALNCKKPVLKNIIAVEPLWADLTYLAADELKGRKTGSEGNEMARQYIIKAFEQTGLQAFEPNYRHPFRFERRISDIVGTNAIGWQLGSEFPDQYIVITAHFDHVGKRGRTIFNGADDNASGVAALLAVARKFKIQPPKHSIIFVATDAEELGLHGAKAFVQAPPVSIDSIKYNMNLDMLSQSGRRHRLYLAGGRESPQLIPVINQSIEQASVCMQAGHDGSTSSYDRKRRINWRKSSDHFPFLKKGIPYLFLGVADHRYYHTGKDTIKRVNKPFYIGAVETVWTTLNILDNFKG